MSSINGRWSAKGIGGYCCESGHHQALIRKTTKSITKKSQLNGTQNAKP